MYRLKLGRQLIGANRKAFGVIITLDPRVLTPNLDGFIPRGKTKFLPR